GRARPWERGVREPTGDHFGAAAEARYGLPVSCGGPLERAPRGSRRTDGERTQATGRPGSRPRRGLGRGTRRPHRDVTGHGGAVRGTRARRARPCGGNGDVGRPAPQRRVDLAPYAPVGRRRTTQLG